MVGPAVWGKKKKKRKKKAKQNTFKLAPYVKTLERPHHKQGDHYTTLVTLAACNQLLLLLTKGQAPRQGNDEDGACCVGELPAQLSGPY